MLDTPLLREQIDALVTTTVDMFLASLGYRERR